MIASKPAPAKIHQFVAELLVDLGLGSRVICIEVQDATYLVTLWRPDREATVHRLSAWDMSRSMRGDPEALARLRAGLQDSATHQQDSATHQ